MTRAVIEQPRPRLDRWLAAGIAVACPDLSKTPRTPGFPASADRQMCIAAAGNCGKRAYIVSVTRICGVSAHSSNTGAHLKNPKRAAASRPTSRDFVHWRFPDAGFSTCR